MCVLLTEKGRAELAYTVVGCSLKRRLPPYSSSRHCILFGKQGRQKVKSVNSVQGKTKEEDLLERLLLIVLWLETRRKQDGGEHDRQEGQSAHGRVYNPRNLKKENGKLKSP